MSQIFRISAALLFALTSFSAPAHAHDQPEYSDLNCVHLPKNPCGIVDTASTQSVNELIGQVVSENPLPAADYAKDESLRSLVEGADPGQRQKSASPAKPKITDIASFIARLPESMRGNSIIMGNSRSTQGASATNPRVILKSPNSDAVVAFNTHLSQKGSNEVEIMTWNPTRQAYDFASIAFSEGNAGEDARALGVRALVRWNPVECKSCHGERSRPKWDPLPEWAGQIPFMGDSLPASNKLDTRQYRAMVAKIEEGKGSPKDPSDDVLAARMRSLLLPSTKEIDRGIANKKDILIPNRNEPGGNTFQCNSLKIGGVDTTGSASRLFDQLSLKNFCSIASELKGNPNWDRLKYAVYGALDGCTSLGLSDPANDFLPPEIRQKAIGYFAARDPNAESELKADPQRALQADLEQRYRKFGESRVDLEDSYIKKRGGSDDDWFGWMEKHGGHPNPDHESGNSGAFAALRYFLEPMGVEVNRWSFSVDQNNYTMGNLLGLLKTQPSLQAVKNEIPIGSVPCTWLKEKSREAISRANRDLASTIQAETCKKQANGDLPLLLQQVNQAQLSALTPNATEVLKKCAVCHDPSNVAQIRAGAPDFQLMKDGKFTAEAFATMLKDSADLGTSNRARIIEERVLRASDEPGAMPPPPNPITRGEREALVQWMRAISPVTERK